MAQARRDLERDVEQLDERVEQLDDKVEQLAEQLPAPAETPLPPAIVGLRFVYSPGEVRLQCTTDAATWVEVPSFRFDAI